MGYFELLKTWQVCSAPDVKRGPALSLKARVGLSTAALEPEWKGQALAGGGRGGGLPSPGASSGVTEGSCWFGPWELRVGFGCLACLMVPNSQRDIAAFYYILWPIRTKHSIVLGSHTAQYTGCCGDGSPSLLRPTLPPERDPQNCLSTYHLYQKVSLSVVGLCPSLPSLR